ncbi:MAG: tyrosine-type recombinase/integrase [Cypionkella sp.]|uniref:tyrosine-type recombinase/integrase n=1 Tax=Cypionkella sp. TaxID=2811411 RepID=UPI002AB84E72|nr:tyrosine-type recombinase/integrase [Cypionkella sp.]MDZ4310597.1 tyrosine-type recombinase/integrase [Cypionkella sp.]MDZ4395350.1 tyrosine-type recombinase/integrase [Cypionkella sp.]
MPPLPLPSYAALSVADEEALAALYKRGTPANTLRAWERDLAYISAWKAAVFGQALVWPEIERVALRFVLDHTVDLTDKPGSAQDAAQELIALGLRIKLTCPAPATLDRRIASWRAFHRMKNLASPFEAPLLKQARAKGRKAAARPRVSKSPRPIDREMLEKLLASCDDTTRGLRDRAILMLGFGSGGRRRSEITNLYREDIGTEEYASKGLIWVRLLETKTTGKVDAPRLPLKGRAARAVIGWIEALAIDSGPLFRPISQSGRALSRKLAPDAIRVILRHRLKLAGLPEDYATPHGLRAGFLTQAALDGAPLAAAMKLSLHRSAIQAQRYYADVEIEDNPATDLLG